ncbi:hypothetical protein, partial [Ureibacillus acetophenoni]
NSISSPFTFPRHLSIPLLIGILFYPIFQCFFYWNIIFFRFKHYRFHISWFPMESIKNRISFKVDPPLDRLLAIV